MYLVGNLFALPSRERASLTTSVNVVISVDTLTRWQQIYVLYCIIILYISMDKLTRWQQIYLLYSNILLYISVDTLTMWQQIYRVYSIYQHGNTQILHTENSKSLDMCV